VATEAGLRGKFRLARSMIKLKVMKTLNKDLKLYDLPQRTLIKKESDIYEVAKLFPEKVRGEFLGWYEGYRAQVTAPKPQGAGLSMEELMVIFNRIVDRMILLSLMPYKFESRHEKMEGPGYDYFQFGQEYVRPLVDWDNSYIRNMELWDEAIAQVGRGENVVLLANHQTEADAAFLPLFFEQYNPEFGRQVYYVAGDRVVSDPLAQPFSMGRNLFCVHSKKYIDSEPDPEVKTAKSKQNRKTLTEMTKAMKEGGVLVWIAPSGGRDRLKPDSGEPLPADFDPAAVELMRNLGAKSGRPTHLYPMAMATYSIMPPPSGINTSGLGEERITKFTGCAISLAKPIDQSEEASWRAEGDDPKVALAKLAQDLATEGYKILQPVMVDFKQEGFVVPNGVQPWKK